MIVCMNNELVNEDIKKIQKKYEESINQLLKKIPEYQDLELNEIQFKITLTFVKRPVIGMKEEIKVVQDTLKSLADCIAFQGKWCQKEIGAEGEYDYCKIKIEAFYYEECKGGIISFKIPELSFEYNQS